MDVGLGLPATIPGVEGKDIVEWSRKGEEAGFSTLGAIDRVVYPNFEPLVALGAAAAVTGRIPLTTAILITPYRTNTALLAKQVATVDRLSGGRLVLGVGIGARDDDYEASGLTTKARGKILEEQVREMKRIWSGEKRGYAGAIGPEPAQEGGPPLVVGGSVDAAFRRAAKLGDGWIMGGGTPDQFKEGSAKLDAAWVDEGRDGEPRKVALAYFALGPNGREDAQRSIGHYYDWLGDYAGAIVESTAVSEEMVQGYVSAFEEAGCKEIIFFPASTDAKQVELLASAVR